MELLFCASVYPPVVCVCLNVCVFWASGLIISDRDVIGVWQSFICHNWHLHPITFSCFFFFLFFFLQLTQRWHLRCFQADTLQWTGNSEDSDKATAAQAGGEKEGAVRNKQSRKRGEGKENEREELFFFCCFILAFSRLRCQIQRSEGRIVSTGFIRRSPVKKRKKMEKVRDAERLDKSPRTVRPEWGKKLNRSFERRWICGWFSHKLLHILLPQPTRPI